MKKMNLVVKGMTCASCEVLIERSLKKVPGVEKVIVNRPQESVEIDCADHVEIPSLQAAVKEQGYLLSLPEENAAPARSSFVRATKGRFLEIGAVVLLLMGVYLLLKELNILPQTLGVTDNMSYGFVFVLGLVAATSTCLAVAGGLLLAIAGKYNE
ncbi:heavy-metal-associated domain-containing protein, partial [Candidatus Woesearchaeota archaeon]|nr:heavy-metal-associated domain-containing protein [Candidatus Woesearchaeota archaeon]